MEPIAYPTPTNIEPVAPWWHHILQMLHDFSFWGNSGWDYAKAIGLFIVIFIGVRIFRRYVLIKIQQFATKTTTDLDDHLSEVLQNISKFFFWYLSFFIATRSLAISPGLNQTLESIMIVLSFAEIIKATLHLVRLLFEKTSKQKNTSAVHGIQLLIKIALWSTGLMMILSNLGINISALIASLGVGGIAVALAAQNVFSDIFSSFSIYFDRPFEIGDYITIGSDSGTVQKVGLKSTRIKTLQGEELVVSNQELTSTRIQNFKKMQRRRISFSIGLEYGTPNTKLKKVVPIIEKIINAQKDRAEFSRGHFSTFADSALVFDFVYYVQSNDYTEYMNLQQDINFAIKESLEKLGVEMAFPTQTVHIVK